jgi:hypothetical protein
MKNKTLNRTLNRTLTCAALAAAMILGFAPAGEAKHGTTFAVSGYAGVNVWVEGGDVFNNYGDVTVWLRAERDCYTSLWLVDTAGFIHVLNPRAACDDGWARGGATYCYRACDLGLDRLDGCGIAYVFGVGSPVPFDYSPYGESIFMGGFGYRITGDPFVACHDFYVSLLPATCRWDYVGVGYARFYVREWVRYPSYLCVGGPGFHVRVGGACRLCDDVYASYRAHAAAPYEAIRPAKFKREYASGEHLTGRVQPGRVAEPVVARRTTFKESRESHAIAPVRVVSTSRTRASETGLRAKDTRATGAMSRAPIEHSRSHAVSPSRHETTAKAGGEKSGSFEKGSNEKGSHEKGARKKVRQAQ